MHENEPQRKPLRDKLPTRPARYRDLRFVCLVGTYVRFSGSLFVLFLKVFKVIFQYADQVVSVNRLSVPYRFCSDFRSELPFRASVRICIRIRVRVRICVRCLLQAPGTVRT